MLPALTIYPAQDANSFLSRQDAEDILDYSIQAELWDALSDDDQKRRLIAAYTEILLVLPLKVIETFPVEMIPPQGCLPKAQALMAMQGLINEDNSELQRIKSERLGPMQTVYQDNAMLSPSVFTPEVIDCLDKYDVKNPNGETTISGILKTRACP
jgi:hypothetical protein